MNLEHYKNQLQTLSNTLKEFDPQLADSEYQTLGKMFEIVYDSGILDITHLDKKIQDELKLELFTTLTKHSGTLAFLVIQILAAHNIMTKNNFSKKDFYFAKKCGIAINHLRAPKTIVAGEKVDGGYLLNGTLTWASGYKIFDTLLIGFHHKNDEKEAMAPFISKEGFTIGEADQTFVGFGLNTVNIELKNYFVKDEDIVSTNKKGNYTKNKSASKTVHYCLYGLGVSSLLHIKDNDLKKYLKTKLTTIKEQFTNTTDIDILDSLRVELFNLLHHSITTGMILNGGKSILLRDNLQRIYRELIMFNSNGLNDTLKSLFKESFLKA